MKNLSGLLLLASGLSFADAQKDNIEIQEWVPMAATAKPQAESYVSVSTGEKVGWMKAPLENRKVSYSSGGSDPIGFALGGLLDGDKSYTETHFNVQKIYEKKKELEIKHAFPKRLAVFGGA